MSEHVHQAGSKIYYYVFGALLFLTVVTVLASFIKVGLALGVGIALFVATIKSSLVVSFFMHMISEKKMIVHTLLATVLLFLTMILLFVASYYSVPQGSEYLKGVPVQQKDEHHPPAAEDHHGS